MLVRSFLLIGSALLNAVVALPSPHELGGGLTILSENDLSNAPDNTTGAAILVDGTFDLTTATATCAKLNETLFIPSKTGTLRYPLSYLSYTQKYPAGQKFWIGQTQQNGTGWNSTTWKKTRCQALSSNLTLSRLDCTEKLPILCTQSAPVSWTYWWDTSERFQVVHKVGSRFITGFRDFYSFRFMGVRYAEQPKRFTYSKVFDGPSNDTALTYGSICAQPPGYGSEDCLFMNIYTSSLPLNPNKTDLKPVMMWIHGGSFKIESNSETNHDGTNLASRGDVVVVQPNYRLGNLGFLALNDSVTTGNYGIQDMITALQWTKKYISHFGGDPDRVTIFGESAGATAVRALLSAPLAQGLFHSASLQSPPAGLGDSEVGGFYFPVAMAYNATGRDVLNQTGCLNATSPVDCLRKVDVITLANLSAIATYAVQDGTILPSPSLPINGSGGYAANVPVMIGTVRDECAVSIATPPDNVYTGLYELAYYYKANETDAFKNGTFLPPGTYGNASFQALNVSARLATDAEIRCDVNAFAWSAVYHSVFPVVYSFMFNRTYSPAVYTNWACDAPRTAANPYGDPEQEYMKCHAGDNTFVLGAMRRWLPDRDGNDTPFARLVVDYWSSFARSHNPNPDRGYLQARGYQSTIEQLDRSGVWEPVTVVNPMLRWLQWGPGEKMEYFQDVKQCEVLGWPLYIYEIWSWVSNGWIAAPKKGVSRLISRTTHTRF